MQKPPKKAPPSTRRTSLADYPQYTHRQGLQYRGHYRLGDDTERTVGCKLLSLSLSPADDVCDLKEALNNPNHPAHKSCTKINALQQLYCRQMKEAGAWIESEMGAPLTCSIADVLNTNASRAYFMMEQHGVDSPVWDDIFARTLVRMAFGLADGKDIEGSINRKEGEMKLSIL